MEKTVGYEIILPLLVRGKIKRFSEIFDYITKSPVAEYLGREKGRFDELIKRPDEFTFRNIDRLCNLFKLPLDKMALLIEPECSKDKKPDPKIRDKRYDIVSVMFQEKKVRQFSDIIKYIPKTVVAKDIGKKGERFDHLLKHVEEFSVGNLFVIGSLSERTLSEMFSLTKAQYAKQNKKRA